MNQGTAFYEKASPRLFIHVGLILPLIAFLLGAYALHQSWTDFNSSIGTKENTLNEMSLETQDLIKQMQKTILLSQEQTRRLKGLSRDLSVFQGEQEVLSLSTDSNKENKSSSRSQFQLYLLDPQTGEAFIDFKQIISD